MAISTQTPAESGGHQRPTESVAAPSAGSTTFSAQQPRHVYDQGTVHLTKQLQVIFGKTAYNHKVHEKEADFLRETGKWISYAQIGLSGLTTGSLLLALFGNLPVGTLVGAVLSFLQFVLAGLTQQMKYAELEQKHIGIAKRYLRYRDALYSLLTDIDCCSISTERIRERRDLIEEELQKIHEDAPRTSGKAYEAARNALKGKEELTFSEDELKDLGVAGTETTRTGGGNTPK